MTKLLDNGLNRSRLLSVFTLMGGTIGAQIIGAASMLLLARMYSPSDFGRYAFFFAIASLLMLLATARYDQAIFVAKNEEDSVYLTLLAITTSSIGAIVVFPVSIFSIVGEANYLPALWLSLLLSLVIVSGGAVQATAALAAQQQSYGLLSKSRAAQAGTAAVVNVGLGILNFGAEGLILGLFCGQVVACSVLMHGIKIPASVSFNRERLIALAREHIQFPRYALPSELLNNVGNNMLSFVTPNIFGAAVLGQYNLGQRIAMAPLSVVGSAIGDVFRSEISPQRATDEMVASIFRRTAIQLALVGLILTLPLLFAGPSLFNFLFGEQWMQAGLFLQILAPMMWARFVVSPLSAILIRAGKQRLDALLQGGFVFSALAALAVGAAASKFEIAIILLAAAQFLIYLAYFVICWKTANFHEFSKRGNRSK